MEIFYCIKCKKWNDFDDFKYCSDCEESDCDDRRSIDSFGCCASCGNSQITKEIREGAECGECHKMFPKDDGTEYNYRKIGIDEVDFDVRCDDCESARETRESDEKSFRQGCLPKRW